MAQDLSFFKFINQDIIFSWRPWWMECSDQNTLPHDLLGYQQMICMLLTKPTLLSTFVIGLKNTASPRGSHMVFSAMELHQEGWQCTTETLPSAKLTPLIPCPSGERLTTLNSENKIATTFWMYRCDDQYKKTDMDFENLKVHWNKTENKND